MGGSISKFVERMRYWTEYGDLGYDQSNRWAIHEHGECDCSSLVIFALREAGFDTGSASYTGDMSENLTKRGWKRIANNGNPQKGDILLNDSRHVAVYVGNGLMSYASIDENGNARGGKDGDQTGLETRTRAYYDYPWDCYLRYTGNVSSGVTESTNTTSGGFNVASLDIVTYGSKGAQTKSCQALLNAKNNAGLVVDGDCGELTYKAIRNYQTKKGLTVDGECGKNTWTKLLTT